MKSIDINKIQFPTQSFDIYVDREIDEFAPEVDIISIEKFFQYYNQLFFDIPESGELSHQTLIDNSLSYISSSTTFEENETILSGSEFGELSSEFEQVIKDTKNALNGFNLTSTSNTVDPNEKITQPTNIFEEQTDQLPPSKVNQQFNTSKESKENINSLLREQRNLRAKINNNKQILEVKRRDFNNYILRTNGKNDDFEKSLREEIKTLETTISNDNKRLKVVNDKLDKLI